jgi:DNA-binding MarR family transcriptional regulator
VTTELDPLIHVPTRLKIVATLAALPDGDALSFTRLQDMLGLTPGNLIIQLRKLEEAGYLASEKTGNGSARKTTVALTGQGRAALRAYTQALRDLLGGLDTDATSPGSTVDETSEDGEPKRRAEIATRQESRDLPGQQSSVVVRRDERREDRRCP